MKSAILINAMTATGWSVGDFLQMKTERNQCVAWTSVFVKIGLLAESCLLFCGEYIVL